jgi:hypothetical protein
MSARKLASTVQFNLSRRLTWAEREALKEYITQDPSFLGHRVEELGQQLIVHSIDDSRYASSEVHSLLSTEFVNVYIKGMHTLYPKVKV